MPFVIMPLTLTAAWPEDVKLLSEQGFEVSVQFLSFKYMASALIKSKGGMFEETGKSLCEEKNNTHVYISRPCNQSNYVSIFSLHERQV